ncbi:hypothetical protein [Serinicoccus marinus]|uniref:hypothetical protein n=1 Tax=Serinicoccus marinus TaxID=247333 RepID=UPI001EE8EC09
MGDRVAVVGAGLIGGALALLLRRFPLSRLQVVEADATRRRELVDAGLDAVPPEEALDDCDLVFHASASEPGLALALALAGDDADVVELSWFGSPAPQVPLGEDFHSRRLRLVASQVSRVGDARRHRRDPAARLATALDLLSDPAFETLLAGVRPFPAMPAALEELEHDDDLSGCVVLSYPDAQDPETDAPARHP